MRVRHPAFWCVVLFVTLLAGSLSAAPARVADEAASLDSLAWLAGHWRTDGDAFTEELWTEPAGGLMLAVNRQVRPGRRAGFEFLRIEESDAGLVYVASPGGREPTRFPLARSSERLVVFENPDHDWPQLLEYRLDEEGVLHVRAAGLDDGSRELVFTMRRVR